MTRLWWIVLVLSLALNLAVAGAVIGAAVRERTGWPWAAAREAPRDPGFGPYAAALTPEDRRALRRAFAAERGRIAEGLIADRADRAALVAALRAEPFDPAALDAVAARMTARMAERAEIGRRLIAAHVATMTPAERAAFADRLEAALARGPGGRRPNDLQPEERRERPLLPPGG